MKNFFLFISALSVLLPFYATCHPWEEQLKQAGYVEICDQEHGTATFESLYGYFDEFIAFLQTNPIWTKKLYIAKERFIRSKDRKHYSSDFFGFYDESEREKRRQVSFYYSSHFHHFICSHYPEFKQVPEIIHFFDICFEIQDSYGNLFKDTVMTLGLETIFPKYNQPPVLFKVIKYLPSYAPTKPHYDGTVLSFFLDSTDNQSLLLAPYQSSYTVEDFFSPFRKYCRGWNQNSILIIPGALLTEFSIYPTPHIVSGNGKMRYAAIAFVMRPNDTPKKVELSDLPSF